LRLMQDKRGVSNIIVFVLGLVIVVIIVVNVFLWNYQMNQLDWDKMREDIRISNVTRATNSSWFVAQSEYTINTGSRISGAYIDTQAINSGYERFREATPVPSYYASEYNLAGSTQYNSGTLSDLQSDNDVYMTFRGYPSVFSTTTYSRGTIGYRSNTGSSLLNSPKNREWNGLAWSSENEMATAGSPVRLVRVAYSPVAQYYNYKIVVALSDDGTLDAYVYNGTAWTVSNNLADLWSGAPGRSERPFDVAFSTTSGDALLVYAWYDDTVNDLAYRRWFSSNQTWSGQILLDDSTQVAEADYSFVTLSTDPTSNSNYIGVIALDRTNMDVVAWTWSGSAFGNQTQLTGTVSVSDREDTGISFDYAGKMMIVAGEGANEVIRWNQWTKTGGWAASQATSDIDPGENRRPYYITLKADPSTDDLMLTLLDDGKDIHSLYWNGASWTIYANQDTNVDATNQRCVDFEWEPSGGKGIQVRGTANGRITWRSWTTGTGWGADNNPTMGANPHPWVQLRRNPRNVIGDVKILGAVLEDDVFDLGAIKWDGSTFTVIGTSTFSTDTTVRTYEGFEIEFQQYGDPTEFSSEVEFTGTSNTQNWTQLVWTIDSAWTSGSVSVTLQLYNYTLGSYPTSGKGYMSYTSSASANTDETQNQTIIQNPTHFRNATGYWKIKVKGVKTTNASFNLKADFVVFSPAMVNSFQLDLNGTFTIDLSTYPLAYVQTVEISLRYRASDADENWYLKAYNWTALAYSDNGFNTTAGHTPTTGWDNYAVNLTSSWRSYANNSGIMYVKILDNGPDSNGTTIDIDFLAVRVAINGANFTFKNDGSLTTHLVSLWVINSTDHRRYDLDVYINSADTLSYIRADIPLPNGQYTIKVVSERGNIAVYSGS